MTTGDPNKDKLVHFIAKIWDPVANAYKPIYTAPDATNQVYGDVLLSDAVDSELDAATGVTAATPKAIKIANDNAETKLSKVSADPQEVVSKVTFKNEVVGEQNITAPTFTGDLKGNSDTTTKIKTPINLNTQSGALNPSGKVLFDGSQDVTIPLGELDATQLKGVISLENLPQGALERVVNYPSIQDAIDAYVAADDDKKPFQEGDTIRVTGADGDTPIMYAVVGNPSAAKNYVEYAAATAANALSADQALKLTTDAGTAENPIYFKDGIPVASNATLGSTSQPVYLNKGVITPVSDTVGGSNNPVYLNAGEITAISNTIGSGKKPIYFESGKITESTDNVGDDNTPLYLKDGELTASTFTIKTSVPENALFTDTTYDVFEGGNETSPDGVDGLVPAPTLAEATADDLYLKSDGTWAKVVGGSVTGVKGNNEEEYRTENVNLTHDNIGAVGLFLSEDENAVQTMQGLAAQPNGPIKTTPGGLLPNGVNSQIGNIDNPFKDVYSENIYADYIYLSEGALNEIVNGDFTVANANKLKQKLIFTGDIEATIDFSTLGDKTIDVRGGSEIAIQAEEPTDENIKLWIKI